MPYIIPERREDFAEGEGDTPKTPGELNYILTIVCLAYIKEHDQGYQSLNDVLGALEGCKQELYRRVVAPYEDQKIKDNGDII